MNLFTWKKTLKTSVKARCFLRGITASHRSEDRSREMSQKNAEVISRITACREGYVKQFPYRIN